MPVHSLQRSKLHRLLISRHLLALPLRHICRALRLKVLEMPVHSLQHSKLHHPLILRHLLRALSPARRHAQLLLARPVRQATSSLARAHPLQHLRCHRLPCLRRPAQASKLHRLLGSHHRLRVRCRPAPTALRMRPIRLQIAPHMVLGLAWLLNRLRFPLLGPLQHHFHSHLSL